MASADACLNGRKGLGHCYHQGTGWMKKGNTVLSNRQMDRHWTDVVRIERKPMHSCDFVLLAILFSFSLLLFSCTCTKLTLGFVVRPRPVLVNMTLPIVGQF